MITISDYLHQKASRNRVPLTGTFELSPVCNFSCKMCYVRKTPEQLCKEGKKIIPWQQWLELAKECRKEGMLYLLLTGGEPFIYPGFKELYIELHKMGFLIYINTNGTMINHETIEWLKQYSPCRLNVTLYGASPETYQRICGHLDGYERTINAINMLKEENIPFVINASMIPENACDLEKIIETGKKLDVNTRVSTYMFPPMRRNEEETDSRFTPAESAAMYMRRIKCQLTPEAYNKQLQKCVYDAADNDIDSSWGQDVEYMRCRAGRSTCWINWEGNMTACGMMDFPLKTNPFLRPFHDCWSELTEAVRNTPVLSGCRDCSKRHVCNPCVAMIYGETGTVDQKAEYMCQLTDHIINKVKEELEEMKNEKR